MGLLALIRAEANWCERVLPGHAHKPVAVFMASVLALVSKSGCVQGARGWVVAGARWLCSWHPYFHGLFPWLCSWHPYFHGLLLAHGGFAHGIHISMFALVGKVFIKCGT